MVLTLRRTLHIRCCHDGSHRIWNDLFPCQVYVTTSDLMRTDMEGARSCTQFTAEDSLKLNHPAHLFGIEAEGF